MAEEMTTKTYKAFTLVEVAVTIMVIGLIVGSAMTILNNLIGAMADIRLQANAFEVASQNMETLLSLPRVRDTVEYGVSEISPDIQWQTVIEPFYEPVTNAMWLRAVCSASYTDSKGQYQEIELEHWLTNLPANVVRQILSQQRAEQEYLDLLSGTASGQTEALLQETTLAYLSQAGLNVDAYQSFLERQRRRKLDHIARYGFDDYPDFLEQLREEENRFLEALGVDFDAYNRFAATYEPGSAVWEGGGGSRTDGTPSGSPLSAEPDTPGQSGTGDQEPRKIWTADDVRDEFPNIPEPLVPTIMQLLNS